LDYLVSGDISSSSSSSLTNSNSNASPPLTDSKAMNNYQYHHTNNNASHQPDTNPVIDTALRKYGWLHKLSHTGLKLWRKRYFVLTDYILDYYSDSTLSKHCGTIFLNNTISRPSTKKDGSSAFNRKNSFKVEVLQSDRNGNLSGRAGGSGFTSDLFVYLAADSNANMNEWINKFNFVSKLK